MRAITKRLTVVAATAALLCWTVSTASSAEPPPADPTEIWPQDVSVNLTALPCVPDGPTAQDGANASTLNPRLENKMRGHMNAYNSSCARAVVTAVRNRGLNERAATIAIATVIVETSIANLDGGDLDSVGLFQQRASWGSFQQRTDPVYATNKFLDVMESFYPNGSWNTAPIGEVAADVQRPYEPYRYRYGVEANDAAIIANLIWNQLKPPVSGVDFSASSAVEFNGQLTVFARGADGSLQHWWLVQGQENQHDVWAGAGSVTGRPVAVVYRGMLNVFYRGADGSLQHWWFDGQAHHDVWGGGSLSGDPTAAVFGDVLTVFARGTDGALHNWWLVHGQPNQHAVWGGGSIAGNPTAVVYNGILSVFGRGTDNALHNWWIEQGQANQHSVWGGGSLVGDPTAAIMGGILSVFGRGTDGALHNWWIEQGRANQHSVWGGGSLAGNPSATIFNGMLSVFGRGTDGGLHNWWIVNGHANQHSVWGGGSLTNDPHATLFVNGSILGVFGRSADGGLHNWWIVNGHANQHSPWGGGNIAP